MATDPVDKNPVTEDRWERLSPTAKSMIGCVIQNDTAWLSLFVEGQLIFEIRNRTVYSMIPSPKLRPGHGMPPLVGGKQ